MPDSSSDTLTTSPGLRGTAANRHFEELNLLMEASNDDGTPASKRQRCLKITPEHLSRLISACSSQVATPNPLTHPSPTSVITQIPSTPTYFTMPNMKISVAVALNHCTVALKKISCPFFFALISRVKTRAGHDMLQSTFQN
jgi:hypothetical protein